MGNGQVQAACLAEKEVCKTLDCMHDHQAVVLCYENHADESAGFTDDAKTGFPSADEVSQTIIQGTSPGHKCGVITHQGLDGYNKSITGDVSATISGAASDIHHTHGVVSTNSNGGDVMPTLSANMGKLGGDNQTILGGGYIIHEL
jgi:hypothetical protein